MWIAKRFFDLLSTFAVWVGDHVWVWLVEKRLEAKSRAVFGKFCWEGEAWFSDREEDQNVQGVRAVTRIGARRAALVLLGRNR